MEIKTSTGSWTPLSAQYTGGSLEWQRPSLDLSAYENETVQVAFRLVDVVQASDFQNPGWYIDQVEQATGEVEIPQVNVVRGFENGMGDWWVDTNVWELAQPAAGPGVAAEGMKCVGTAPAGYCPTGTRSRLVSPVFTVPGGANYDHTTLWFSSWYELGFGDEGLVQVSVFDGAKWGPWSTVHIAATSGIAASASSGGWKDHAADLTPYRGMTISIGFLYTSNEDNYGGAGWFIDEIELQTAPDTDGDGLVNLLDSGLGLNPIVPDRGGEPKVVKEGGYLTLTVNKQPGYSYTVESAGGLQPHSWSAATTTVLINNATTLKVRDNVLIGAQPSRFMHVVVTSP